MIGAVDHIEGTTFHGRRGAVENAFRYSVDYVLLDAEAKVSGPALFGRNRRNLIGLDDRDHGGVPKGGAGAAWVRDVLQANGLAQPARIELLAQPRVMGHVFNPVSFWLCRQGGGALIAVIAEVTNTFGDRHSYLCVKPGQDPITPADRLTAQKIFHVSPFQPVEGGYTFRFDIRNDKIGIWIDYAQEKGGVMATLTGRRSRLTVSRIVRMCLRRPFGSRRVLGLIHWQALKLWWKGARYRPQPAPPMHEVSRG